ncbi:MAG: hypothetical protein ABL998_04040 [Planctomycetota bacterium]
MTDRIRSTLVALSLTTLVACHESSDQSQFLAPGVQALGFATEEVGLSGGVLAAREFEAGDDQNGDGDGEDTLLRIVNLASGFTWLVPNVGAHASGGGLVAFTVPEARANEDLNGDGDELDQVLHVFDARRRTQVNTGFATDGTAPLVCEGFAVAVTSEADQGADLDGDAQLLGTFPVVHDAAQARASVLDLEVTYQGESMQALGGKLVGFAREDQRNDLNGDGDEDDELAFWHDLAAGTTTLGFAADDLLAFDGELLVYLASESEESEDIDGDGTEGEPLCVLVELESGAIHLQDEGEAEVGGGLAFLRLASESLVFDTLTGTFGVLPRFPLRGVPKCAARRAAFLVEEFAFGDGNGDGDQDDALLFLYDARTGLAENTALALQSDGVHGFELDAERVVFLYSADCDLNGNCPGDDAVLRARRHADGAVEETVLRGSGLTLEAGHAALLTPVSSEVGRGLPTQLGVYDFQRAEWFPTGLQVDPFLFENQPFQPLFGFEDDTLVVGVREDALDADGNGDGDTLDTIVNAVRLR